MTELRVRIEIVQTNGERLELNFFFFFSFCFCERIHETDNFFVFLFQASRFFFFEECLCAKRKELFENLRVSVKRINGIKNELGFSKNFFFFVAFLAHNHHHSTMRVMSMRRKIK